MEDNFLVANAMAGVYYLATSENDQPHVRPFDGAVVFEGKFYIGTKRTKDVFKQIEKNPKVEIFGMENGVIRFTAEAFPVDDDKKNEEIFNALGKEYDKDSVAIELKNLKGTLTDSMGEKNNFSF